MDKPQTIYFSGKSHTGLSESSAKIEVKKRDNARRDYVWAAESYETREETFPHAPCIRWRVAGILKQTEEATI